MANRVALMLDCSKLTTAYLRSEPDAPGHITEFYRQFNLPMSTLYAKSYPVSGTLNNMYFRILAESSTYCTNVDRVRSDVPLETLQRYLEHAKQYGTKSDVAIFTAHIARMSKIIPPMRSDSDALRSLHEQLIAQVSNTNAWYNAWYNPSEAFCDADAVDAFGWSTGHTLIGRLSAENLDGSSNPYIIAFKIFNDSTDPDSALMTLLRAIEPEHVREIFGSYPGALFMSKFIRRRINDRDALKIDDSATIDRIEKLKDDYMRNHTGAKGTYTVEGNVKRILDKNIVKRCDKVEVAKLIIALQNTNMAISGAARATLNLQMVTIMRYTIEIHGPQRFDYAFVNGTDPIRFRYEMTELAPIGCVISKNGAAPMSRTIDPESRFPVNIDGTENVLIVTNVDRVSSRDETVYDETTDFFVNLMQYDYMRIDPVIASICAGRLFTPRQTARIMRAANALMNPFYLTYQKKMKEYNKSANWVEYLRMSGIY